jgi:hypothetical protein
LLEVVVVVQELELLLEQVEPVVAELVVVPLLVQVQLELLVQLILVEAVVVADHLDHLQLAEQAAQEL